MTQPGRPPRGLAEPPELSGVATEEAAAAIVHESPEALREIVDRSEAVIYVKDLAGRYLLINRRFEELFHVDRRDCLGRDDFQLLPREIAEPLRANDHRVVANGRAHEFEEVVTVDGEPRTYISLKFPLRDADGRVFALCGMSTDITGRKRIEENLRESEARFRTLADSLPVLVWLSGPDKAGVWFNKTWLGFTGRGLEEELGEGWVESVHPDDRGPALDECLSAFEERRPFTTRFRLRRHDGEWRWMLDVGHPRFTRLGSFLGYVGSAFDVTEQLDLERALREKAAELAEADRRKDEFLAMLGHELRNPLAPIRNALELVRPAVEGTDGTAGRGLAIIDRQLRQLTRLVDDLLDVGRIRNGEIRLRREPVELAAVVESAVETVGPLAAERRQPIEVDLPEEPVRLDADPARLAQVLANLLHNAAKYSPPGSPIGLRATVADGTATIRVRDRGEGIDPAALPGIFELFYRGHQGDDARHSGLGVGLTLVKSLVELHGGRVEALSEGPRRGTEISVRLPCLAPAAEDDAAPSGDAAETGAAGGGRRAAAEARPPAAPRPPAARRRILVVDDNRDTAESLAMILSLQGHDVATADDGPSAVAAAERQLPEVVLLDVGLPGFDGYEVARRLRADGRHAGAVLVAVTGHGLDDDRRCAVEAGFDHHLLKPVDLERLVALLAGGA